MSRRDHCEIPSAAEMAAIIDLRSPVCALSVATVFLFLAAASPARAAAPLDVFVALSGDPQPTLALEKATADALARNDRRWFAATARRESRPLNRGLSLIEAVKRTPAEAMKLGPCSFAWLTLRSYIVQTARDSRALSKSAPLSEAAPQDVANRFAEHMNRCELVKRLPRSKRLIGVDANRT